MPGSVFYRSPEHDYPMAARGDGVYLYDRDGKQYLDGSGGAAVSCLGHGHPRVIAAIRKQLEQLPFAHTAFFTNEPQEDLAARLAARFPERDARVCFLAGGSEANEAAMKLARQYWKASGQHGRCLYISRRMSYHGNTLGALSLSGFPGRRELYADILSDWPKITQCFAYHNQAADETERDYGFRCANELERAIVDAGPENVIAFVAETVAGATLGAVPPPAGYFRRIREICDKYDVLLILDEIMCGSGRTGSFFAFEHEGVLPDIVTLAKGIGAGYQPLAATICRGAIHQKVVDVHGEFAHGHTYIGHATACAAGVAVQQELDDGNLLQNVDERGSQLRTALADAFAEHPHVGDIRGRGLFVGVELVRNRESREPAPVEAGLPAFIKNRAMDAGLVCYPGGGGADGRNGAHILLAPPFIYEPAHVDELVSKLQAVIGGLRIA